MIASIICCISAAYLLYSVADMRFSRGEVGTFFFEAGLSLVIVIGFLFLLMILMPLIMDVLPARRKKFMSEKSTLAILLISIIILLAVVVFVQLKLVSSIPYVGLALFASFMAPSTLFLKLAKMPKKFDRWVTSWFGLKPLKYITLSDGVEDFEIAIEQGGRRRYTREGSFERLDDGTWKEL